MSSILSSYMICFRILDYHVYIKFDMEHHFEKWTQNGPCYNTTIYSQLSGQKFEDYFEAVRKDRYELMCDVDAYDRAHQSEPYHISSGDGIPYKITPYTSALESLGDIVNFIDNLLRCFFRQLQKNIRFV